MDSDAASEVMDAMGSETARRALTHLHDRSMAPSELAEELDTSIPNVQYHLENLQEAGLVTVVDSVYSEKGVEMDVYGPVDDSVVFVPSEKRETAVRNLLTRVAGAFALLIGASFVVQWFVSSVLAADQQLNLVRKATSAGEMWSSGAATVHPGFAFLAGGSFVLALGVTWWYWHRARTGQ